jgi:hypothetical protein
VDGLVAAGLTAELQGGVLHRAALAVATGANRAEHAAWLKVTVVCLGAVPWRNIQCHRNADTQQLSAAVPSPATVSITSSCCYSCFSCCCPCSCCCCCCCAAAACSELVDNTHFEKSLRLVISFGSLKRSQFVNALEERLKPALAKVGKGRGVGGCRTAWGGGGGRGIRGCVGWKG